MFVTFSSYQTPSKRLAEYRGARERWIDTALLQQEGFISSTLLGSPRIEGPMIDLCHANVWADKASAQSWTDAPSHRQVAERVDGLMLNMAAKAYDVVLESSRFSHGERTFARLSWQEVRKEAAADYIRFRGTTANVMDEFPGFVEAWTLRSVDQPESFLVIIQWHTQDHSKRFVESTVHKEELAPNLGQHLAVPARTSDWDVLRTVHVDDDPDLLSSAGR